MKITSIVCWTICLLLSARAVWAQNNPYDEKERERISKNKISSATLWLYKYKSGVAEEIGSISWAAKFDRFGNHLEDKNYLTLGSKGDRFVYKYDYGLHQNPIEKQWYDPDGKLFKRVHYDYDAKGTLLKREKEFNPDSSLASRIEYVYNTKGLLNEERTFLPDSAGTLDGKWTYEYDWQDNRISATEYSGKDSLFESKNLYLYNAKNSVVACEIYDKTMKRQRTYIYQYDENGRKFEELWYDSENKLTNRFRYQYDGTGNKTETAEYNSLNIPVTLSKYKYEYYK